MLDWMQQLWDTSSFPARWHCGEWTSLHGWIHILSDLTTFAAYTAIPFLIGAFLLRKKELPFPRLFLLFALFIFSCGTVHFVEAILFWHPIYRISAVTKVLTALVSVATVVVLVPNFPKLLALPSAKELEREITQRKAAEAKLRRAYEGMELLVNEQTEELKRSNRDLEQFAYAVSHDLKAPLRAIINLSQWLEEELGDDNNETIQHYMLLLRDRTLRMRAMLQGLLEYARAGKAFTKIEEVNVEELCRQNIDLLSPPPDLTIECKPPLPTLHTVRAPLQQVLLNLLSNAISHGGSGGWVQVSCVEKDDVYELAVADNGPGIDPIYHETIFDMYQTLEVRDTGEGTGMGLAIVKRAIEGVGGQIELESEAGQGAIFRFTWPKHMAKRKGSSRS